MVWLCSNQGWGRHWPFDHTWAHVPSAGRFYWLSSGLVWPHHVPTTKHVCTGWYWRLMSLTEQVRVWAWVFASGPTRLGRLFYTRPVQQYPPIYAKAPAWYLAQPRVLACVCVLTTVHPSAIHVPSNPPSALPTYLPTYLPIVLGRFFDFIITSGSGVLIISKIAEPLVSNNRRFWIFEKKFNELVGSDKASFGVFFHFGVHIYLPYPAALTHQFFDEPLVNKGGTLV